MCDVPAIGNDEGGCSIVVVVGLESVDPSPTVDIEATEKYAEVGVTIDGVDAFGIIPNPPA